MKALKSLLICMFVFLMAISMNILCFGQDNILFDKEKLANLIDSPRTKQILAAKIDGYPNINFDMETMVFDPFRKNVVVSTVDFEHVPSGRQGTVSFAHRWVDADYVLLHASHWWWGTVVSGNIASDTTWNAAGSPYYVTAHSYVEPGVTLTIEPGAVIRFRKSDERKYWIYLEVEGILNCQGATFTTNCDFENYDNSQVEGENSDWWGIWVFENGTCTIEDSVIEYADESLYSEGGCTFSGNTIRRGTYGMILFEYSGPFVVEDNILEDCEWGIICEDCTSSSEITGNTITMGAKWWGWEGLVCDYSSPIISSNSISGYTTGIICNNSSPEVTLNTIQNNLEGIFTRDGSSPVIHNNNIAGNFFGLYNGDDMVMIDAENNWWGHASGPYHPTLNPGGLGDEVSDYVDFDPWLTSAVAVTLASLMIQP